MSADNWATCPRCLRNAEAKRAEMERRVAAGYGVLPLAEFDALRAEVDKPLRLDSTWREDYEFYGAEMGAVTAVYSGSCTVCMLSLNFTDTHQIEGLTEEADGG